MNISELNIQKKLDLEHQLETIKREMELRSKLSSVMCELRVLNQLQA